MLSSGITTSMPRLRTSLVTMATSSACSLPNYSWYTSPAPATCEVSCTEVPKNRPARKASPANSQCAAKGYISIASMPNSAIQATA